MEEDVSNPKSKDSSVVLEEDVSNPKSKDSSVVLEEDVSNPKSKDSSVVLEEDVSNPKSKDSSVLLEVQSDSPKSISIKPFNKKSILEIEEESEPETKLKKSVEGLKLANPYYFQSLLEKRDPKLFLSLRDGKFDGYSRMCPSATRRQPTILTQSEFDKFLKEKNNGLVGKIDKGVYHGADVIKYGSNDKNTHYYMCPKYWCLLNNQPLSQKQVDEGECGGKDAIIPKNAKSVPKGKSIFEFYEDSKLRYPGFHKELTPNGHCIPCCYKLPYKDKKNNCSMNKEKQPDLKRGDDKENYVKGPEKVPLAIGRWGHLPTPIENIFKDINVGCTFNKFTITTGSTCLLRLGVENNLKQSFISCIATILFYGITDSETKLPKVKKYFPNASSMVPSIKQMKEIIKNSIKKTEFAKYQNGDLISIFESKKNKNILTYDDKLTDSFNNFNNFLMNDEILIDYTYLWDIICLPNENLFPKGINMVIIDIVNNDETNNVEIVCPSNHYSSNKYNPQLGTILIVKQGNFYEPILSYTSKEKSIQVSQIFYSKDKNTNNQLKTIMDTIISPIMNHKCNPISNQNNVYTFIQPIKVNKVLNLIKEKGLTIRSQVQNFQGKIIGFQVFNNSLEGFIPCYPSSPLGTIDKISFNEVVWPTYSNSLKLLEYFFGDDKKKMIQIAEEMVVVGLLAPTNQFIQIDPPLPITEASVDYPIMNENNYLAADIATQLSNEEDKERIDFIKRISLESKFYSAFRNTLKIELNKYDNIDYRNEIENITKNNLITYNIRLLSMKEVLFKILSNKVIFIEKEEQFSINDINEIYTCIVLSIDKCNSSKPVCEFNDGICNLVIPKTNLVTQTNNQEFYYSKLADELLRYNRIKSFLMNPQTFISFGNKEYNLKEDEILILQSLITQSYFENKVPLEINKYANFNTYDTAHPQNGTLTNEVTIDPITKTNTKVKEIVQEKTFDEGRKLEEKDKLCKIKKTKIISKKWKNCFPENYNEINYENNVSCGYKLLKDLIYEINKKNITTSEIKKTLIEQYKYLINEKNVNQNNLIKIFIAEGKQFNSRDLSTISYLEEYILQENYWLSNLDMWILLNYNKINSVYISPFILRENNYKAGEIIIYNDNETNYLINIILPSQIQIAIPNFKVVIDDKSKMSISKNNIDMKCYKNMHVVKDDSEIQKYINDFKPKKSIQFDVENPKKKLNRELLVIEE